MSSLKIDYDLDNLDDDDEYKKIPNEFPSPTDPEIDKADDDLEPIENMKIDDNDGETPNPSRSPITSEIEPAKSKPQSEQLDFTYPLYDDVEEPFDMQDGDDKEISNDYSPACKNDDEEPLNKNSSLTAAEIELPARTSVSKSQSELDYTYPLYDDVIEPFDILEDVDSKEKPRESGEPSSQPPSLTTAEIEPARTSVSKLELLDYTSHLYDDALEPLEIMNDVDDEEKSNENGNKSPIEPIVSAKISYSDHTYALHDGLERKNVDDFDHEKTSPTYSPEPFTSDFQQQNEDDYNYKSFTPSIMYEPWNGPSTSQFNSYKYTYECEPEQKPKIEMGDNKPGLLQSKYEIPELKREVKPDSKEPKTEPYVKQEPRQYNLQYAETMPFEYKVLKRSGYTENVIEEYLRKFFDRKIFE